MTIHCNYAISAYMKTIEAKYVLVHAGTRMEKNLNMIWVKNQQTSLRWDLIYIIAHKRLRLNDLKHI